jgi:hypothetical protein
MKTESKAKALKSLGGDAQGDFAQFTNFMRRLVAVPHSQIKARLEEEKKAKKKRVSVSHGAAV